MGNKVKKSVRNEIKEWVILHYKEPKQNKIELQLELDHVQKIMEEGEVTKEIQMKENEIYWEVYMANRNEEET